MSKSAIRLRTLIEELETSGSQPSRLAAARSALGFRQSWVELAGTLSDIRKKTAYKTWGYSSFSEYFTKELGLKTATVDKLLVSFATLNKHAPKRIAKEDDEHPLPSYQALDYFARATGEPRVEGRTPKNASAEPPNEEVVTALRQAVFEEGKPLSQIRKEFDPVLRPKTPAQQQLIKLKRTANTAQRLRELLTEVEGIEEEQIEQVQVALDELYQQIEEVAQELEKLQKEAA